MSQGNPSSVDTETVPFHGRGEVGGGVTGCGEWQGLLILETSWSAKFSVPPRTAVTAFYPMIGHLSDELMSFLSSQEPCPLPFQLRLSFIPCWESPSQHS